MECNMITLRYIEWDQNIVTPLAAVHLDLFEDNGKYWLNDICGTVETLCLLNNTIYYFWSEQKKETELTVHSVVLLITLWLSFGIFCSVLDENSDVSEEGKTHTWMHMNGMFNPEIGNDICPRNIWTLR